MTNAGLSASALSIPRSGAEGLLEPGKRGENIFRGVAHDRRVVMELFVHHVPLAE